MNEKKSFKLGTVCINITAPLIIFSVFFFFLILQYREVFLYSDDYGYGSMTYAAQSNYSGVIGFFDYLRLHYMNWGGRVLYYSILILGVKAGINFIRAIECFILLFHFILIYDCIKDNNYKNPGIKALTVCCLYGIFDITVISQSLYWYSAAITYTLPLIACLLFFSRLLRDIQSKEFGWAIWKYMLLAFVLGFSQEQYAITACCMYAIIGLWAAITKKLQDKRFLHRIFIIGISLLTGASILIFAPGNFNRSELASADQLSISTCLNRLDSILKMQFSVQMKRYVCVLTISLIIISIILLIKSRRKIFLLPTIFFLICFFTTEVLDGIRPLFNDVSAIRILISYLYWPVALLLVAIYAYFFRRPIVIFTFAFGIMTSMVMIVTSEISLRTFVPLIMMSMVVIADAMLELHLPFKSNYLIVVGIWIFLISGVVVIYKGYNSNYEVNKINFMKMTLAAYEQPEELILYKNVDDTYSYVQPYMYDGFFKGQEANIKYYFGIRQDTEFIWVEK